MQKQLSAIIEDVPWAQNESADCFAGEEIGCGRREEME